MSGLFKSGVDANPFGSKFSETTGGVDAGNGKRTYTKPSFTLFVVGIPDAECSDAVSKVFEVDRGFLQCRPVGHKLARRMVFVDYDSIANATAGMQAHQGHKWEEVDEGLKIDFDQDAREKRNTALDQGLYEKFWAVGPRVARGPDEKELFSQLRAEALEAAGRAPLLQKAPAKTPATQRGKRAVGAHLKVKGAGNSTEGGVAKDKPPASGDARAGESAGSEATAEPAKGTLGLAGYGSDSSGDEEEEEEEEDEDEEEEEEVEAAASDPKRRRQG